PSSPSRAPPGASTRSATRARASPSSPASAPFSSPAPFERQDAKAAKPDIKVFRRFWRSWRLGVSFSQFAPQLLSGVPRITHPTPPAAAQAPWLHQEASVWCVPFGHGTHTGAQSSGPAHAVRAAPDFQAAKPTTDAQVVSTFSLTLTTELGSVACRPAPVH